MIIPFGLYKPNGILQNPSLRSKLRELERGENGEYIRVIGTRGDETPGAHTKHTSILIPL